MSMEQNEIDRLGRMIAKSASELPADKAKRIGVPLVPALPQPHQQNGIIAICGECGREIMAVEGYYCPLPRCPVQTKPTFGNL